MSTYYTVTYRGHFGYIKPWTAVRDGETMSQAFLTPSTIEGMRQKLGVGAILRHRLSHSGLVSQQEVVQSRGISEKGFAGADLQEYIERTGRAAAKGETYKRYERPRGILTRHVMYQPVLHLAFSMAQEAALAASQHLCLCRNEDLVYPDAAVQTIHAHDFDRLDGFELQPAHPEEQGAFLCGYNRFTALEGGPAAPMYGRLQVVGTPVRHTL